MRRELEIDRRFIIWGFIGALGLVVLIFLLNRYDNNQRVKEVTNFFQGLDESKLVDQLKDKLIDLDTTAKDEVSDIYKLMNAINDRNNRFHAQGIIIEDAEGYVLVPYGQYEYRPMEIQRLEELSKEVTEIITVLKKKEKDPFAVRRQLETERVNNKIIYPLYLNEGQNIFLTFVHYADY